MQLTFSENSSDLVHYILVVQNYFENLKLLSGAAPDLRITHKYLWFRAPATIPTAQDISRAKSTRLALQLWPSLTEIQLHIAGDM